MKKALMGCILAVIGIIIIANTGVAEEKRKTLDYHGIVQEVDVKAKTITVAREKLDLAMLFDAAHTAFKNVKGLDDLRSGDKVLISYDAIKGKTIAITLTRQQ